jgi:UDP-N-acetylmuramoyl-tripeptide--D-alanyl-D-alanine ligase
MPLQRSGRLTIEEVIGAIHPVHNVGSTPMGTPIGPVTSDSRAVAAGSLFVALPGERVDGADFVAEAFRKGASAAIVSEAGAAKVPPGAMADGGMLLVVHDPVEALGDLAQAHRRRHRQIPLVGITGSSGKTSTKEMLYALLSRGRSVLRNQGNRNNLIGMPLTLLELSDAHDVAVIEMGTNRPGEIARLADIAAPDLGIVTNVAPAHLEGLGSMEGVAREKGDLFRALPEAGTAVVNATDLRVVREAGRCRARKVYFGVALNEFSGRILAMRDDGMEIAVRTPSGEFTSPLQATGEHQLMNALAATAAAYALGLRPDELQDGFAGYAPAPGRFRAVPLRGGGLLLDDCYNANPASMESALRNMVALARGRNTVAVLADMLELGDASPTAHRRIGHLVAGLDLGRLVTFGRQGLLIAQGAAEGGMPPARIVHADDRGQLREQAAVAISAGDVVLVKGSRGMRLDEIVTSITEAWA